jgi:anaerobic magnesium-protoporphyrin IX monomethyl ester cyclase
MNVHNNQLLYLIQAPYFEDYGPMRKAAGTYFPVGLGYISSFVKQHGYNVSFVDLNVQDVTLEDIVDFVRHEKPVLVGVSFMTPQFYGAKKIADAIKDCTPDVHIVFGGAHPSVLPRKTLAEIPSANFIVSGEGEQTTLELLDHLTNGRKGLAEIDGLAWREEGEIVVNRPRELIEDLDSLPYPDRDLIDQSLYHAQSFLSYSPKAMTIYTSRGCPGRCVFCASGHRLRSRIRERSITNVMKEIDYLRERFDIDYLLIKDDTFTLRKTRVEKFCDAILQRHPSLKWHCMVRVNSVDQRLLSMMKSAGLNDVFLGIESGNNEILKKAQKGITVEKTREVVEACAQLRISSYGAFILGLPCDTAETIEQTIRFACSLPLTMAGFSILIPYPGTQVCDEYFHPDESKPIDYHKFVASSGIDYVEGYSGVDVTVLEDLPVLVSRAQRRFYLRMSQVLRMLGFCTQAMLWGYVKGFCALCNKEIYLRLQRNKKKTLQKN